MSFNILFVVVLYKENLYNTNTYRTLLMNSEYPVYIYDNSPQNMHSVNEFNERFIYVSNEHNPGLSKAYNIAAQYALKNKFEWILLLDQDTIFPINILPSYIDAIQKNPQIKLFCPKHQLTNKLFLSPVKKRGKTGQLSNTVPNGVLSLYCYIPINSGLLVNIEAFWNVGGYNEKVRLDFSDYQFIEKFRTKYEYFYVLNEVCKQNFSNDEQDEKKLYARFLLYLESVKNCKKESVLDNFLYSYVVLKHTIALTIKVKRFIFLKSFLKEYVFKL